MSSYTIVSLHEVENTALAKEAGVEGRFARKHLGSRDLGVSLWRYPPGHRASSGHSHRVQEEAYLVVGGSGQILLDGEAFDIGPWDLIRVAPEVVRGFAAGAQGLEVVAIGGPKPEGGDGVPAEITWPA